MTHRFPIKEIALQTGLGTATIDRVLNNRTGVSPQTRKRVEVAIEELTRQEAQLAARGRRMFFDFVVEAPVRFSREVQKAAEAVLPQINTAVCRPRFLMQEHMSEAEMIGALKRIAKRGSQGVCLKARDLPAIRDAIDALTAGGIPVVTLVTDIPASQRLAYVGMDNIRAGQTAAYLVAQKIPTKRGQVLTITSQSSFLGEEDRAKGFATTLAAQAPQLEIIDVSGGGGTTYETTKRLADVLHRLHDLVAVYSMGGGNDAVLKILQDNRLSPDIFIAHDLDAENRDHLTAHRVNFVLSHDLSFDIRRAFDVFLGHHGIIRPSDQPQFSNVEIKTAFNI